MDWHQFSSGRQNECRVFCNSFIVARFPTCPKIEFEVVEHCVEFFEIVNNTAIWQHLCQILKGQAGFQAQEVCFDNLHCLPF